MEVDGKYYREVMLKKHMLPVMRRIAGDTFVFQQHSAPAHRDRETVQLLQQETTDFISRSVAAKQSGHKPGSLPNLGTDAATSIIGLQDAAPRHQRLEAVPH